MYMNIVLFYGLCIQPKFSMLVAKHYIQLNIEGENLLLQLIVSHIETIIALPDDRIDVKLSVPIKPRI